MQPQSSDAKFSLGLLGYIRHNKIYLVSNRDVVETNVVQFVNAQKCGKKGPIQQTIALSTLAK